jgi:uncharacterized membrane protein YdjX (TVP38/TMEM64 family)
MDRETSLIRRRLLVATVLLAAVAVLTASGATRLIETEGIALLTATIARHRHAAMALFIVLAGTSAMLAFFSSTLLVPLAIDAWGATVTFLLLWVGWLLGGIAAFTVGRGVGGALLGWLVPRERIAYYERRVSADTPLSVVLLLQLALPSELPGYLLGTLHYRFRRYLLVVGIGELPFAFGTVYLGESFLRGDTHRLVLGAVAGIGLIVVAATLLRRRLGRS